MVGIRIRRKLPLILGCVVLIFLALKRGKQLRTYELFIPNQEPKAVWDFVADFSNMPKLNTKIQRWELLDETGNYERWSYRVVTYETMVGGALFGLNENHGEVLVEPVKAPDHYYLQEVYTTYSLHGYLVVRNHGKMHFRREVRHGVRGTFFQQEAFSDCPLLLAPICSYEIDHNRRNFLANLASAFAK
ncbi:uncharacterized protein LOC125029103 [Penaeus chinensis]|uniref:uncharacterized protein LOC125029103 n=1 Tax=Penaeus chinensis TaxID=139456 RepID=UPI001FB6273E|nr:uncharacterized protein LOC125029103 [Penaeus chinensis]